MEQSDGSVEESSRVLVTGQRNDEQQCRYCGEASRSLVERIQEISIGGGLPSPNAFIPVRYLIYFCIIMYFYSLPLYFNETCHRLVGALLFSK